MAKVVFLYVLHVGCWIAEYLLWQQKLNMPVPLLLGLVSGIWLISGFLVICHVREFLVWWFKGTANVQQLFDECEQRRKQEMAVMMAPRREPS